MSTTPPQSEQHRIDGTFISISLESDDAHRLGVALIQKSTAGIKKYEGRAFVYVKFWHGPPPEGLRFEVDYGNRESPEGF